MHDGVASAKHKDRYSQPQDDNWHCRLLCMIHFVSNAEAILLVQLSRLTWNDFLRLRFKEPLGTVRFLMGRSGNMKIRTVLALAVLVGVASPAWADFYVVQDVKTKKCTIVDKAPTTTTTVTRVGSMTFKTREEATSGMAKEKVCVEK
jgi:hypothetical protein